MEKAEQDLVWCFFMIPKTRPLCSRAELNLGDRVLDEVEKNSFIALPGKGGTQQARASQNSVSNLGDLVRSFIAMVQGQGC